VHPVVRRVGRVLLPAFATPWCGVQILEVIRISYSALEYPLIRSLSLGDQA
jgi:hypothetical protein